MKYLSQQNSLLHIYLLTLFTNVNFEANSVDTDQNSPTQFVEETS